MVRGLGRGASHRPLHGERMKRDPSEPRFVGYYPWILFPIAVGMAVVLFVRLWLFSHH